MGDGSAPLSRQRERGGEGFCKRLTMLAESVFFWIFATVLVGSALAVISARDPVHSVLFLIIVMLLDLDLARMRQGFVQYLPQGILIALCVAAELVYVVSTWSAAPNRAAAAAPAGTLSNTAALGEVLYTRYFYFFQASGMILLTAMIGAIVITLHHKAGVKRQDVGAQVARDPETAVELRKVTSRAGI